MRCQPCDRGHGDCERDGHVLTKDLTAMNGQRPTHRIYLCGRCNETFRVPACEDCGMPVRLQTTQTPTVGARQSVVLPASQYGYVVTIGGARI